LSHLIPRTPFLRVYSNRRILAIALLGFSSGLPLALTEDTLSTWLRRAEIDLTTIGLFSLVGLPAAFQVFWAPLVDRYAPPLLGLGRRRAWMLLTQLLLIVGIVGMALAGPRDSASPLFVFGMIAALVSFTSATQDIALNAYRADVLPPELRGAGAASFITGYRLAMIATGAGILALVDVIGWSQAYLVAAGLLVIGLLGTAFAPEPPGAHEHPQTLLEAVIEPFRAFLATAHGPLILLFVFLFKLPDYLAARMTSPFLVDLGFSNSEIALVRQTFGLAMTIVGALCGGGVVASIGLRRSLLLFGSLQLLSNAGFLYLATVKATLPALFVAIGIENFCTGLVAAGFVAYLMSCCDRRFSATQYALLTSVMLLGNRLCGAISGALADQLGYPAFFAVTIAIGIPGMMMLLIPRVARMLHPRES